MPIMLIQILTTKESQWTGKANNHQDKSDFRNDILGGPSILLLLTK